MVRRSVNYKKLLSASKSWVAISLTFSTSVVMVTGGNKESSDASWRIFSLLSIRMVAESVGVDTT